MNATLSEDASGLSIHLTRNESESFAPGREYYSCRPAAAFVQHLPKREFNPSLEASND